LFVCLFVFFCIFFLFKYTNLRVSTLVVT
jgi:hypothetical protein